MSQHSPIIRVLLCGGLGNQLFQYAFARALALRSGVVLELDAASLFAKDTVYRRHYELDAFKIPEEVTVLRKRPFLSDLRRKWLELRGGNRPQLDRFLVQEPRPLQYYPEFASWRVTHRVCLLGYWQCERYFREIETEIRQDLSFRESIHPSRQDLADEMKSVPSVALHVRRTQYERKLDLSYYETAMDLMGQKVPEARFFVFTDDPAWWQQHGICGPHIQLVPPLDLPSIEDFKLMTRCQHFIIANSSFSWWAAWLGQNPNKQIVASEGKSWSNLDTVPEYWTTVRA